ncbi:hypothetical protein EON83_06440 [bacterium]|nr:MAG: hypothetical protein EON83_06440 [bacterium]
MLLIISSSSNAYAQQNKGQFAPKEQAINSVLEESRQGIWLVQAKCISLTNDEKKEATWQIDYVFNGEPSLENQVFTWKNVFTGFDSLPGGAPYALFTPTINEEALWAVRLNENKVEPTFIFLSNRISAAYAFNLPVGQYHPMPWEIIGRDYSTYAEAIAHAQAIERIAKFEPATQIRLLQDYAQSPTPLLCLWAIATLAGRTEGEIPQFLFNLTEAPSVPVAGLLALEVALHTWDSQGKIRWDETPQRLSLWQRIVTSPAQYQYRDGFEVQSQLHALCHEEGRRYQSAIEKKEFYKPIIASEQLFSWLKLAVDNAQIPANTRAEIMYSVAQLGADHLIPRQRIWDYLLAQIENHPDWTANATTPDHIRTRLANNAARSIRLLQPLTTGEIAVLQELQVRIPELNSSIGIALKPPGID